MQTIGREPKSWRGSKEILFATLQTWNSLRMKYCLRLEDVLKRISQGHSEVHLPVELHGCGTSGGGRGHWRGQRLTSVSSCA